MAKSNEPFLWSLFSAGGVVAGFFTPAMIVVTGLVVPIALAADWVTVEGLYQLVRHPVTRIFFIVVISLPLFHWAHRFRFAAVDMGLKGLGGALALVCYSTAIIGTILAVFLVLLM